MLSNTEDASREACLVGRSGHAWHHVFRLTHTEVALGRDQGNTIVLDDEECSRRHCEIRLQDDGWVLRDLNSRNGTTVNGQRITNDHRLRVGDVIGIGKVELRFAFDVSQPIDGGSAATEVSQQLDSPSAGTIKLEQVNENTLLDGVLGDQGPEILERKSQTRYITESHLYGADHDPRVREAFAKLYGLIVKMVSAANVVELCEQVLEGLLPIVNADIGAVLLFPDDTEDRSDPDSLRTCAYRALTDMPYHRVSPRLSKDALVEGEAILAIDVPANSTNFKTLNDIQAESVICAPIRQGDVILGLLHMYSLQSEHAMDADALELTLAVADQLVPMIAKLSRNELLAGELQRANNQNRSLRKLLEVESDLVGQSHVMRQVCDTIARVANSDATVLVSGESGVGKELVARAIHFNSNRREKPFVCMNCAALTETLLESELFGHEKGAFTGATSRKIGKFEQASGGTLFLDEVGDMSLSVQAKFLRVLEGHPFERVGGNQSIRVDTRVVAATNRDLETAIEEGSATFRKDLFFRLRILEIHVPCLRQHMSDLPELVDYFLERCCQRMGRPVSRFSTKAMELLCKYDWPGNVRELRNVIERAVVMADGLEIKSEDVRLMSRTNPRSWFAEHPSLNYEPVSMESVEREHILRTLQWTSWNKRETARILEFSRSTLDRKLERYEIRPPTAG